MTEQSFSLIPFAAPAIAEVKVTGKISRQHNVLALHYSLVGNIESITIPSRSIHPGRKDELWKATCFEFFLAIPHQPQYWEFNMSPSGDWNIYRMDAYRRVGVKEETSIQRLPFETQKVADTLSLNVTVDLSSIFENDAVEVGIAAIIQTKDGHETYWALTHPAPQADFHSRESFTLVLAAQTHLLRQSAPGD